MFADGHQIKYPNSSVCPWDCSREANWIEEKQSPLEKRLFFLEEKGKENETC